MAAIVSILSSIGEFFSTVADFVIKLFDDLVFAVKIIGEAIAKIPSYIGFLPAGLIVLFVSALSIIIVYKILGRD